MFNSPILEVIISLVFIFMGFSLIVSFINESIVSARAIRGRYLRKHIGEALYDRPNQINWGEILYSHPGIDLLGRKDSRPPAYIPADLFAKGLIDLIIEQAQTRTFIQDENTLQVNYKKGLPYEKPFENFKAGVESLKESDIKILLETFIAHSDNDLAKLQILIVKWYENLMDRMTGWYKNKIRKWLILIGICVAIIFNINTLTLIPELYRNNALRSGVVKAAETYINSGQQPAPRDTIALTLKELNDRADSIYFHYKALKLPIGWDKCDCDTLTLFKKSEKENKNSNNPQETIIKNQEENKAKNNAKKSALSCYIDCIKKDLGIGNLLGWLITGIALSYGAPFWYDLLKKFVNVRSAGIKPEEKNKS